MNSAMNDNSIVVVGASVGGVHALRTLVAALPPDFPAALAAVIHIGSRPSILPDLLSAASKLQAQHAENDQTPLPGRIYVAPPDCHLLLDGNRFRLSHGPKEHHTRPAIDPLFRSAALAYGPRAIGVVLTGRLDDGTAGLQAIKECGGVAVVQDPADALEPGMPSSALQFVEIDHCVPLARIGEVLIEAVSRPPARVAASPPVHLIHEHQAALGRSDAMQELSEIGTPSPFVCPDCHGALWELKGSRPPRYRCHVGHAFSIKTLEEVQSAAGDAELWSALRALQEREQLLKKLSESELPKEETARVGRAIREARTKIQHLRELIERSDIAADSTS